ncbi:hypothetical protein TTRE_0000490101 [Trichuris trichiura]|uniref:Uncharacterized protein n=1 Tax=Trichuris trichiura TaxID=36087 RepID=A0A077Z8U3_TRITR|nr:hypothetical protein TTRE_0000490101 [Trichuris trichiura]
MGAGDNVTKDGARGKSGRSKAVSRQDSSSSSGGEIYEGHFKWIEGEKDFFYINSPPRGSDAFATTRPDKLAHNGYSPPEERFEICNQRQKDKLLANLMETNIEEEVVQKRHQLKKHVRALNKRDNGVETDERTDSDHSSRRSLSVNP